MAEKKRRVNRPMLAGGIIIAFFVLVAVFADVIAPYDPSALGTA